MKKVIIYESQFRRIFLQDPLTPLILEQKSWYEYWTNKNNMSDEEEEDLWFKAQEEDEALALKYYNQLKNLKTSELVTLYGKEKEKWKAKEIKNHSLDFWTSEDTEFYRAIGVYLKGELDKEKIKKFAQEKKPITVDPLPGPFAYIDPVVLRNTPIIKDIIDIFYCGSELWKTPIEGKDGKITYRDDYWHCVLDNLSIAVSALPIIGTIGSAFFDLANAVYYGYDFGKSCFQGNCNWWDLGGSGFAFLGILPGVTEVNLLRRLSIPSQEAANRVLKEVLQTAGGKPNAVKNLSPKKTKFILTKHTKDLTDKQRKEVAQYLQIMQDVAKKSPAIEKYVKQVEQLINAKKWTRKELLQIYNSRHFKKLMKENGDDIFKVLKKWPMKHATNYLKLQLGLTVGLTLAVKGIATIVNWLSEADEETKDKLKEELYEIKIIEESGADQLDVLYKLFNVIADKKAGGCNLSTSNPKEYWENISKVNCPARDAALYAYKQGLRLKAPTTPETYNCICDWLDANKWEIVMKAYKKYLPHKVTNLQYIQDDCIDNPTAPCPELMHIKLPELTIYSDEKKN